MKIFGLRQGFKDKSCPCQDSVEPLLDVIPLLNLNGSQHEYYYYPLGSQTNLTEMDRIRQKWTQYDLIPLLNVDGSQGG